MQIKRYPEETVATLQDFLESPWKSIVDSLEKDDSYTQWQVLSKAATDASEEGKHAQSKVLWLLADANSMMLKPSSVNEPFALFAEFQNGRSAISEDFTESDLDLLVEILPQIQNLTCKARLADILWLRKKQERVTYALIAIDAYRNMPLDDDNWAHGAYDAWERAITLCFQLGKSSADRLSQIESSLVSKFLSIKIEHGFFGLKIAEMLRTHDLAKNKSEEIAKELETKAARLNSNGENYQARSYFEESSNWYGRVGQKEKQADMIYAQAETWIQEAEQRAQGEQKSYSVAASFFENAIQTLRTIPRKLRESRKINEKIDEIHQRLSEAGKASLHEMGKITTDPIDITALVESAQKSVQNKPILEALASFANIYPGANREKISIFSGKMLKQHPLQALFSATHISRDGRVVAKRPGMGFGDEQSPYYQNALWAEMVKHYSMEINLIVQAQIWPALQVFSLEHRIRETDLIQLAGQSPIVPRQRLRLVGKALFAGFEKDFASALHLLVPQIENIVRWHLKAAGAKTTTLDPNGIENENGLSTIIDLPEAVPVFGEDLTFEIKALFCDSLGSNLRNEVAHGLIEYDTCESAASIYAWWLMLRVVFNTFWNASQKSQVNDVPAA
jgi:hypothetical protein